uniref:NADH-ubiquinone oxidoreductase chain 5 n=1 Tax=Dolicheulota formosensis TaxID=1632114 RepID=A0A0H3W561_DOLFO|nr:NADH dehydrogenase subunit 5 [Dolicheulota formosensis]AKJ85737.1 NADH dehydrogenase subunit 5 [Dolicheulota formosensis]
MLVMFHKQRITVLLFVFSLFLVMVFMGMSTFMMNNSYMLTLDILSLSTNFFELSFLVDKISLSFSGLVCLISACVFMFGRWYMSMDLFYWRFIWILLSFVISMNVLVYSGSLLMLLVGWDGLGVSSFALIIYYQSSESLGAGFLTLLINRIGDVLIMSTMFYFVLWGSSIMVNLGESFFHSIMFLLCLAALTKSAQYPFSAWLPAAMAAPTPVSALVHSSTLVTAGIYILIRVLNTMSPSNIMCSILLFCGSLTSLVGGLCAFSENDLKKVIAYSTLSQLGVMIFSLGLNSPSLALLHLYTHAMFKAMLFLVAGCILMVAYGTQDIRLLGSVTKNSPVLLVFLNTSTFCLIGLPFLSAYYSKHSILYVMLSSKINVFAVFVMLMATMLSGVYMFRLLKALNWGNSSQTLISFSLPFQLYLPLFPLYLGSIVLGWFFFMVDMNTYTLSFMVPDWVDLLLYFLLFFGLFFGVFLNKSGGFPMLINMFYMEPLWKRSNYMSNMLLTQVKNFEVGWVEPYTYFNSIWLSINSFSRKTVWPKVTLSFGAYVVTVFVMFTCWYSWS